MKKQKFKTLLSRVFKKHKLILRSIAVTLVLVLLFTSMPLDGFAALAEQWVEDSKLITIEKELEQYRTEFSKTYLKSDGTLESVVSSNPIHFKEDGEWVEIDSSLEADENEKGTEILKNKKGSFNVELPTEIEKDSEIAIEKGKNKISIKLLETKSSKAKKNKDKKEKAEKLTKAQRKRMTAGELFEADNNQTSAVEYNAVYNDTNVRYDVTPNEVKESIVLQKAPNKKATYSYEITADGLTAVLNKDNSIDFYEGAKTEKATPVFSMPAPHMFDSNGEYSYDIATTLENKKGKYILTYKPSYEWLKNKNRAYPVTVDPTVVVNSGIQDSYTFSGEGHRDSYTGYEQQLKVGTTAWIAPNDYWQTYLKFTDLPQIPYEDYRIDSAYLMLTPKATTGSWQEMELGVYELTADWKNHQTGKVAERITFNNAPEDAGYSTATATVARGGADNGVGVGFEIAHIMEKWYENPEENFGIKLAAHLEENQYNDNLVFHSSRSTTGTAPYLSLTYTEYVPVTGIEIIGKQDRLEYWSSVNGFAISANVYPENATNKDVVWESTNPAAAYYDYGYIMAAGIGTTTIIAKSADNNEIIDSFELEVYNIPIETITITNRPENDTLESGSTHQLGFEVGPDNATDKYFVESGGYANWYSSNTDIAYVTYECVLNAICCGTTTITASYGSFTDSFTLTVTGMQAENVYPITQPRYNPMYIGEACEFTGAVEPLNAADQRTVCISSNPDVVRVDSSDTSYSYQTEHTLTALSEGSVTIRLEAYNDSSVYYEFTVDVSTPEKDIGLNLPYNNTIAIDETWQISTNSNAIISIGDNTILSDEGNGYIKGLKAGTTTVEISSRENSSYYIRREITVLQSLNLEIIGIPTVTDEKGNSVKGVYVGKTYEGLATQELGTTTPLLAEWYSSDESIAEVYYEYESGRVVLIGKKPGTVIIYADVPGTAAFAKVELTVVGAAVTSFGIDAYSPSHLRDGVLYLGEEGILALDVYPKDPPAYFNNVNWFISNGDKSALSFDKYSDNLYRVKITPVLAGDIEVSADINNIEPTSNLPITIKKPHATIKNKPSGNALYKGDVHTLKYTSDPKNVTVTWHSSNSSIAGINKDSGKIDAKSSGYAVISIKVKYGDFEEITDSFTLDVRNQWIWVDGYDSTTLVVGDTVSLRADVGANSSDNTVCWKTSDSSIASVDSNGKVTANAPGTVTITAYLENHPEINWPVVFEVYLKEKSYIYYTNFDNADKREDIAKRDRQNLAEKFYGGDTSKIELVLIENATQFKNKWNSMESNLGYVVINCHSRPEGLIQFNSFYKWELFEKTACEILDIEPDQPIHLSGDLTAAREAHLFNQDIKELSEKGMRGLILLSCNAGHLDYVDVNGGNVAMAFSEVVKGAPVIASDGTVGYGTVASHQYENLYKSRGENEGGHFIEYSKKGKASLYKTDNVEPRTTNEGWMIFQKSKVPKKVEVKINEEISIPKEDMKFSELLEVVRFKF